MPEKPAVSWYDGLFEFTKGVNSGLLPLLLPRNTLSFAINSTVRGGFITHRPCLNKLTVNYGGNMALQLAVETGLFQGSCYYRPDFGLESLVAQISGRLFQFIIDGNTATCVEVTIPGDPNPSTVTQAWLWQAEKWVIVNDGQSIPIYFDGTTSRRSNSNQTILGTTAANFTSPAIGASVGPVALTAPFLGNIGDTVILGGVGASYQVVGSAAGYDATVVNLFDPAVTEIATTPVTVVPDNVGYQVSNEPIPAGTFAPGTLFVTLTMPSNYTGGTGKKVNILGKQWVVNSFSGKFVQVKNLQTINGPTTIPAGTLVTFSSSPGPNTNLGTLVNPFTVPAVGSPVAIKLSIPFTGAAGTIVFIGTGQYALTGSPPAPAASVTLINVNDTAGQARNAPINLLSVPELPPGRMGAYGMGRNWMVLTDGRTFIASDIVGGSSGSILNQFRDAVLRTTENTFLAGGGTFVVPGNVGEIRSMTFSTMLDNSLGLGPLMVGTPNMIFTCKAPVERADWQGVTNPILAAALIGDGTQGQNSTVSVNSDILFRSRVGLGSLIIAQRYFGEWGNSSISSEMTRTLILDPVSLLTYSSGISFDNRYLITSGPNATANGVYWFGQIALDYFPISNLAEKLPPVYDGLWTGINAFQWMTGQFQSVPRAMALSYNSNTNAMELYELLATDQANFDNGSTRIVWEFESASLFNEIKGKGPQDLARLVDGEIYVSDVVGQVDFQTFYKPDQYPCWIPWHSWSICSTEPDANNPTRQPTYRTRMGMGTPSADDCDSVNNRPLREGYTFQFKAVITGHCKFLGARFRAVPVPDFEFAKPICDPLCTTTT